jgi:hypothetical protein
MIRTSTLRDLIHSQKGKTICVMGGAESLEAELKRVKADIYISTNGHGAQFREPLFVVAMDDRHTKTNEWMRDIIRQKTGAPIVGPFDSCDIYLDYWPGMPRRYYSGIVAMWFAHMLGAKLVILAGMDGYKAEGGYMAKMRKIKIESVPNNVRTTNESLAEVVPVYDPKEKVKAMPADPVLKTLKSEEGVIVVEVMRPCPVLNIERVAGEKVKVYRKDVLIQLKHQMVREL